MDVFNVLTLVGGLSLFLFGMNIMGEALEKRAGSKLRTILGKLTTKKIIGLLTGLGITAIIQSSSATTVMVVGFVNSGLMTLKQAINVIMGANIGTTVTAWILSLSGIESGNLFVQLLKPTSFTPVLALIGIVFHMFSKDEKKQDTGTILLGFATLMFGMDAMSGAVSGLSDVPQFRDLFIMFKNPILGVLAGAVLTAIIQSSSASVGILQALAVTGQVSYGAAIPIIMGQNIGTCITAMISGVGANKNAKRAATLHLLFNVIGTVVLLVVYYIVRTAFKPVLLDQSATLWGIAVAHTLFNLLCTAILYPTSSLLEKLVIKLVPDGKATDIEAELDERLLITPPMALGVCRKYALQMAELSFTALKNSLSLFGEFDENIAKEVRESEKKSDHYEDILGTYLVKLSAHTLSQENSLEAAMLLKVIGDFERISDHGVNIMKSAQELNDKGLSLSQVATDEFKSIADATKEVIDISYQAFRDNDIEKAEMVEPLEEVIDGLKRKLKSGHIERLQKGECTFEVGFVWNDLINNLERVSDHCSNIAGHVMDNSHHNMNLHESLGKERYESEKFNKLYKEYSEKYSLK